MIKTVIKIFKRLFLTILVGCTSVPQLQTNGPITTEIENKSIDENKIEQIIANGLSEIILDKKYFIIHYDRQYKLAKFVEYKLRAENLKKSFVKRKSRKDPFHSELALLQLGFDSVEIDDYKHSGYDRGHLAPSADFEWSEEANEATFTMANMVPQMPGLNKFAWKGLEEEVRKWASQSQ
jgi:endonuclease G